MPALDLYSFGIESTRAFEYSWVRRFAWTLIIMKICIGHISEFGACLCNISDHWWHVCKHSNTPIEARSKSKRTTSSYVFRAIFACGCVTKCVTSIFQSLKVTILSHIFSAIFACVQQNKSKTQKKKKKKRIVKSLTKWEIAYGYEILSMMLQWDHQTPTRFGGCTYI